MVLEIIKTASQPMYNEALDLYRISFPSHKQREPASQERILADDAYHFCLAYDESEFVGLVLYWETDTFLYIEHFCILPAMRNRGYGQKVLSILQERKKTLILEIDPPVDDISRRREGFYNRCGFAANPFPHIHPPYHKGTAGHKLVVMTSPGQIPPDVYRSFEQYLRDRVMKNVF